MFFPRFSLSLCLLPVPVGQGHHDVQGSRAEHEVEYGVVVLHALSLVVHSPPRPSIFLIAGAIGSRITEDRSPSNTGPPSTTVDGQVQSPRPPGGQGWEHILLSVHTARVSLSQRHHPSGHMLQTQREMSRVELEHGSVPCGAGGAQTTHARFSRA